MVCVFRFLFCMATGFAMAAAHAAPALQRVDLPPLPSGVVLRAHWLPAEGGDRRPAVLALHGCGGLYAKGGGWPSVTARRPSVCMPQAMLC